MEYVSGLYLDERTAELYISYGVGDTAANVLVVPVSLAPPPPLPPTTPHYPPLHKHYVCSPRPRRARSTPDLAHSRNAFFTRTCSGYTHMQHMQ